MISKYDPSYIDQYNTPNYQLGVTGNNVGTNYQMPMDY